MEKIQKPVRLMSYFVCVEHLHEVTEDFWRLSRTAEMFEILSQSFEVTSAEWSNHA